MMIFIYLENYYSEIGIASLWGYQENTFPNKLVNYDYLNLQRGIWFVKLFFDYKLVIITKIKIIGIVFRI